MRNVLLFPFHRFDKLKLTLPKYLWFCFHKILCIYLFVSIRHSILLKQLSSSNSSKRRYTAGYGDACTSEKHYFLLCFEYFNTLWYARLFWITLNWCIPIFPEDRNKWFECSRTSTTKIIHGFTVFGLKVIDSLSSIIDCFHAYV